MKTATGKDQRSFKNILVRPKQQLTLVSTIMALGMLCGAVITTYVTLTVKTDILQILEEQSIGADVATQLFSRLSSSVTVLNMATFFLCLLFGLITLVVNHRIYGPMVAILNHIRKLRDKNFDSRIQLRKMDDFQEIAVELNLLTEELKNEKK